MRKRTRPGLPALAAVAVSGVTTLAGAEPARADHVYCPANYVCLYDNINFNHAGGNIVEVIHVSSLYDCKQVELDQDGWVSSVYNNTKFAFRLYDTNPFYLIGTAAPFKGYGYLGARGNDALDLIVSPGCL